jgi:hypothetical protein
VLVLVVAWEMVQDCVELEVEVELALHAEQPFVQLIHLEDEDKSELGLGLVELELELGLGLDDSFLIVEWALLPLQPSAQLMQLEDGDIRAQVVQVQVTEQVVVEQDSLQLGGPDADVEEPLEPLLALQPPVQLILLEDYYTPDHSKLQVAQGQQKDLHYY